MQEKATIQLQIHISFYKNCAAANYGTSSYFTVLLRGTSKGTRQALKLRALAAYGYKVLKWRTLVKVAIEKIIFPSFPVEHHRSRPSGSSGSWHLLRSTWQHGHIRTIESALLQKGMLAFLRVLGMWRVHSGRAFTWSFSLMVSYTSSSPSPRVPSRRNSEQHAIHAKMRGMSSAFKTTERGQSHLGKYLKSSSALSLHY